MNLLHSIKESLFLAIWRLVSGYAPLVIAVGGVIAAVCAAAAWLYLGMDTDHDRLVSPEIPYQARFLELLENFGDQEFLFIVIHTGGTEEGKTLAARYADRLAERLQRHPDLIEAVYYRLSPVDLGTGALLYASPEEARALAAAVGLSAPALSRWYGDGSLAGLLEETGALLGVGAAPPGGAEFLAPVLGALEELLGRVEGALAGKVVDTPVFDLTAIGTQYFFTPNERFLIMRVLPDKDFGELDIIAAPLALIRGAMAETGAEFPGVEAGLTGRPVLQADEMRTTERDMTLASVLAILAVGTLFTVMMHGWRRPAAIVVSLLMAMAWTFGFATAAVGSLNLLSVVFALVLIGIGVDFGVHIVSRFLEAHRSGEERPEAVRTALLRTGPGVLLGGVTSSCAFFSVLGSDFLGLAELGLIGGIGILLCLLAMLTVLPALLLTTGRRQTEVPPTAISFSFLEHLACRPKMVLLIVASVTLAGLPGLMNVGFSYDLLELQARGLESVEYERLLIEQTDESTWLAAFTADSLEEMTALRELLQTLETVGRVETILDYLPREQEIKRAIYAEPARALAALPPSPAVPAAPHAPRVLRALETLEEALMGMQEKLFAAGAGEEVVRIERILGHIDASVQMLAEGPDRAQHLDSLQGQLRQQMGGLVDRLRVWLRADEVTPWDLPPALRDLFIGRDGRFQLTATPSVDVWSFNLLERFVLDLRRVDPTVSGPPVVVYESARLMHQTFISAAALTILFVSLILYVFSRSLLYVGLTLLPLGVGIVWMLALMGFLGVEFNLANFFAIPILIAIGVDGGVHFLARWREQQGRGSLFSTSTPTAVALSFATTTIGFGGLLLAHHRGLASLGALMVLGSLSCLAACQLVLPAVLRALGNRTWR